MSEAQTGSITVFIRKGNTNSERWISFARPAVSSKLLLEAGFAIDGNQCVMAIPTEKLLETEKQLIATLFEYGYSIVEFK